MQLLSTARRLLTRHLRGTLPAWRESEAGRSNHVVQFYAGPFPTADVADFLRAGAAKGEAGLVVATPAHTKALRRRLAGVGPITFLDAEATLDSFLVHGHPDRVRFFDTVGVAVRRAAAEGNGTVRAFGEMVVLLCERGDPAAAAKLESLWNELGARQPLSLMCSYPVGAVNGPNAAHHATLRGLHTHVKP